MLELHANRTDKWEIVNLLTEYLLLHSNLISMDDQDFQGVSSFAFEFPSNCFPAYNSSYEIYKNTK